jgi:hypothetical protein
LEKEVASVLETTWVKATGFPTKAQKGEIIKEISHLVGGPIEVDDSNLLKGKAVRVKVWCKDASKVERSTLLYINGQGHMITLWSEKLEGKRNAKWDEGKFYKFDRYREDSDEEEDKEDSLGSHDSGLSKLAKEQKEENEKKREQQKAAGHKQQDSEARVDEKEFMLSQTDPMNKNRKEGGVNEYDDEEEVDYEDSLENDKTAMKKLDAKFEERTSKVSKLLNIQKKESDWMEIDRKDMRTKEGGDGETKIEMSGGEDEVDQFSIVSIKKGKVTLAARSSKTVEEKSSKILDKAMDKKRKRISSPSHG